MLYFHTQGPLEKSPRSGRVIFHEPSAEDVSEEKSDFSSVSDDDDNSKQTSDAEFEFEIPKVASPVPKSESPVSEQKSPIGGQEDNKTDMSETVQASTENAKSSTAPQTTPSSLPGIAVSVTSGAVKVNR